MMRTILPTKHLKLLFVLLAAAGITAGAFFLAGHLTESGWVEGFVSRSGIIGAIVVAFVCGLNFIVPVPPATFAPIFIEAGVSPYLVITGFVIGTTIADSLSYLLGWIGKTYAESAYPKTTERLHRFMDRHAYYVLPVTFAYFAFAPLPNEILLIPLALSGYRFRMLLIPMVLGSVFHHSLLVLGYQSVFEWLF